MRQETHGALVDVLFLDVAAIADGDWPGLAALVDDSERARAARFAFEADRRAYVGAHALLRVALSRQAQVAPADWRFEATPHGKPFLASPPRDLRFSLSHTRGRAAVAISLALDVGLDVEGPSGARDALGVAERFFAREEAALIRAEADAVARNEVFLSIWTLKEAIVKADGRGLARALDSFVVSLSPLRVTGVADENFSLAQWRRGDFCIAAAAKAGDVSFRLEEACAAALIRAGQIG